VKIRVFFFEQEQTQINKEMEKQKSENYGLVSLGEWMEIFCLILFDKKKNGKVDLWKIYGLVSLGYFYGLCF
jgi:hypothetical protein